MPTSGPPQLETARRRSSGLIREQYITGVPGRVAPAMTKLASTSACCWARQPARVIGPVAPREGAGSEWKGTPASAITMMAAVTFSVKIRGLTGETAKVKHGRRRSASGPPAQAAAISMMILASRGFSAAAPATGLLVLRSRTDVEMTPFSSACTSCGEKRLVISSTFGSASSRRVIVARSCDVAGARSPVSGLRMNGGPPPLWKRRAPLPNGTEYRPSRLCRVVWGVTWSMPQRTVSGGMKTRPFCTLQPRPRNISVAPACCNEMPTSSSSR